MHTFTHQCNIISDINIPLKCIRFMWYESTPNELFINSIVQSFSQNVMDTVWWIFISVQWKYSYIMSTCCQAIYKYAVPVWKKKRFLELKKMIENQRYYQKWWLGDGTPHRYSMFAPFAKFSTCKNKKLKTKLRLRSNISKVLQTVWYAHFHGAIQKYVSHGSKECSPIKQW